MFVTALLRSPLYLSMAAVRQFVSLEENDIPPRLRLAENNAENCAQCQGSTPNDHWENTSPYSNTNTDNITFANLLYQSSTTRNLGHTGSLSDSTPGTPRSTDEEALLASFLGNNNIMISSSPPDGPTGGFLNPSSRSQGMASAEAKAGVSNNQQDKWRKVFLNMRVKLKPHDIAVSDDVHSLYFLT